MLSEHWIQWGSEIRTSLDFKWSEFWMRSEIQKPRHLKSIQMGPILRHIVKKKFEIRTKHWDYEWSGFQMVGAIGIVIAKAHPFENRTIWNWTFENGRISDPNCICELYLFPAFNNADFAFRQVFIIKINWFCYFWLTFCQKTAFSKKGF